MNERQSEDSSNETAADAAATEAAAGTAVLSTEEGSGDGGQAVPESRTGKVKGKKPGCESKKEKAKPVLIPFRDLAVSKWNESFGTELDKEHIRDLMEDIKRNRLMHPVTLTSGKDDGGQKFTILTGARRVAALRLLRGEESGLRFGEFKIHDNLNEGNAKCLEFSLAENTHRYGRSVIDRARFIGRMMNAEKVDQTKLAKKFNIRREIVNRLAKLAECLGSLPGEWRKDLAYTAKSGGKEPRKSDLPRITLSHWIEIAGKIGEDGAITDDLKETMVKAHKKRWSTGRLRRELKAAGGGKEGGGPEGGDSGKTSRLDMANLRKLVEKMTSGTQGDGGAIGRLMAEIEKIEKAEPGAGDPQTAGEIAV